MGKHTATVSLDGKDYTCPVIEGTMGEAGIDISRLRADTGLVTYDPGLGNTAACTSDISYIDGEAGELYYRGVPIHEFVESPNFIEVSYLLIFGELPDRDEYMAFSDRLSRNCYLHEGMRHHFQGFPDHSPPMAMLSAMLNVLACYHPQLLRIEDDEALEMAAARLLSKIRTIAAYSYRHSNGLPPIYPDPRLDYCANFLHMMFSEPYQRFELDQDIVEALHTILILHAEHGQNASTSTVRVVGSSGSNMFTSVASAVSSLWGPLHGGANVAVMEMLSRIIQDDVTIEDYLEKVKRKECRLMGFGHRVYKSYDPRAKVLQKVYERLIASKALPTDDMIDTARRLEEAALADDYFVSRGLYPNVDFYSGIILRQLGIPTNMFTVMFAMGRLPGWIAHWSAQHYNQASRIYRPRQIYTGETPKHYIKIIDRRPLPINDPDPDRRDSTLTGE